MHCSRKNQFAGTVLCLLAFVGTGFIGSAASAQSSVNSEPCVRKISYAIDLANSLGQVKQVSGAEVRGNLMELYVNPETGSWTLVLVLPQGLACKIGNGTDFKVELSPLLIAGSDRPGRLAEIF